jgi:hypothetical protein
MILFILKPIFLASYLIFPYAIHPFKIINPILFYLKIFYLICYFVSHFVLFDFIFSNLFRNTKKKKFKHINQKTPENFSLLIGFSQSQNLPVYIEDKGLYQNILITGTIGSGKTSSAMYPFASQLISYYNENLKTNLGMLILDVKGNFYKQIKVYTNKYNRTSDLIVIGFNSNIKYNPLDKPNLKASVLANRLRTILELFSTNNSESYWLDKAEQALSESIKLCRLYNNNYVTFVELHKLINIKDYYYEKVDILRNLFQAGKLSAENIYNLYTAINFFEKEFNCLDERVLSILKSEITRITSTFISDYKILQMFSPPKKEINFNGFNDVLKNGKIVILNMNIAEYKNLSKLLAAYLKLDFQSEVIMQLSNSSIIFPSVFICDEYQEYVTSSDADFFSQSREAKCINIISTQSYNSILNTLKNEYATKAIIQNLINKIWLRTDDSFTIEEAQKQIGKEDKTKVLHNISENAGETNFNFLTNSLKSKKSNISESISTNIQTDFIFDNKFFTQELHSFECLAFLSDGNKILTPQKIKLIPYFKI